MKHKEPSDRALLRINYSLQNRYNKFSESVERHEYLRNECTGGYRFASLLDTVIEATTDRKAVIEAWKMLYEIADHRSAGSISWEMRRFVRRAPPELLPEFFHVVRERAGIVKDRCFIDMDLVYSGSEQPCDYIEHSKRNLEREKATL
jgi:hypothetical protein